MLSEISWMSFDDGDSQKAPSKPSMCRFCFERDAKKALTFVSSSSRTRPKLDICVCKDEIEIKRYPRTRRLLSEPGIPVFGRDESFCYNQNSGKHFDKYRSEGNYNNTPLSLSYSKPLEDKKKHASFIYNKQERTVDLPHVSLSWIQPDATEKPYSSKYANTDTNTKTPGAFSHKKPIIKDNRKFFSTSYKPPNLDNLTEADDSNETPRVSDQRKWRVKREPLTRAPYSEISGHDDEYMSLTYSRPVNVVSQKNQTKEQSREYPLDAEKKPG